MAPHVNTVVRKTKYLLVGNRLPRLHLFTKTLRVLSRGKPILKTCTYFQKRLHTTRPSAIPPRIWESLLLLRRRPRLFPRPSPPRGVLPISSSPRFFSPPAMPARESLNMVRRCFFLEPEIMLFFQLSRKCSRGCSVGGGAKFMEKAPLRRLRVFVFV